MSDNSNPAPPSAPAPPPTYTNPISNLRQPNRVITGHNSSGQSVIHSSTPFTWSPYADSNLAFSVPYTTSSFPADLNADADIVHHERVISSGTLGLVNPRGTVLRCVDFAPGYACAMHRTQSLDYGIVLEGEVDMVLDSGERVSLKRGDVAVQRGTQHQWINRSQMEWARMIFVLQDCKKLVICGQELGEDLGESSGSDLPASGN
ncbi:hypothetical protein N657DRAFT_628394 [Parathielavia appendiculata]|uniref:Cupin type-2 domain-containing protein n=1 Tax=Parathielavia appendiculata TaxID=2587402 RepID=A0AAN6TQ15_9PEZI|nr:hypothetical protein N657DRAFT_628394 [Parathielavia appendiculata]